MEGLAQASGSAASPQSWVSEGQVGPPVFVPLTGRWLPVQGNPEPGPFNVARSLGLAQPLKFCDQVRGPHSPVPKQILRSTRAHMSHFLQ